ncbi:hypothetical protein OUZ56_010740 [Daphnia magna]|uniref:Uncharacterized protein n=1 Tax=Daphnia magna TaxID=35525 RepID=A0ABQ9YYH6_9CRUS|nr:hypothetical protein OUZ56_010740 [Daphnia magna]
MAMCLLKFKAPPRFSVKGEEGVTNWMERYEVLVEYNWWTDLDKRKNFGLYLEGPERQFTALLLWGETAVVAVTHRIRAVPAVHGMRTVFMNEFVQGGPARYQEVTLRKRKQGIKRSGVYYYEFMNLSRLDLCGVPGGGIREPTGMGASYDDDGKGKREDRTNGSGGKEIKIKAGKKNAASRSLHKQSRALH